MVEEAQVTDLLEVRLLDLLQLGTIIKLLMEEEELLVDGEVLLAAVQAAAEIMLIKVVVQDLNLLKDGQQVMLILVDLNQELAVAQAAAEAQEAQEEVQITTMEQVEDKEHMILAHGLQLMVI